MSTYLNLLTIRIGYPQVTLTTGVRVARVHRLVAEMFLEPPSKQLIEECAKAGVGYVPVNHKDNNHVNNCVENLGGALRPII